MIDQRIMDNHTNFIGKIVGININTATIQPLIMYKVYGEKTTKQLREIGVRHILESKDTTYVSMFYKIKESML